MLLGGAEGHPAEAAPGRNYSESRQDIEGEVQAISQRHGVPEQDDERPQDQVGERHHQVSHSFSKPDLY